MRPGPMQRPERATVAPLAGAWIEMAQVGKTELILNVAPLAGAWIEMPVSHTAGSRSGMSLPSRERGLKFSSIAATAKIGLSLPSRERGLKSGSDD